MILHDIFEQREPYQQAIDALQQRRIEQIEEYIKNLKIAMTKVKDAEQRQAIQDRISAYEKERVEHTLGRTVHEVEQPQRPPAKGLLKGRDLVTPQQRVSGATSAKPGVIGAVKDVVGGIKRFVKGEPDQGPTYEAYMDPSGQVNPKTTGNANMGLLIKANSFKQVRPVTFEFPNMAPVPLDAHQTELISDYYDGLGSSGAQTHFIYNVLSNYEEVDRLMTKLGAPLKKQAELLPQEPGSQGQLPLSEKKKSQGEPELKAGDVKVARELQKLRAQYPAARSDVEAVARAEIDSAERSRQQIAAIRGANEKQDSLLKQLVALDREQGKEIDNLDQENDTLDQQLAQVQATNDRLQQTIAQMTGTKSADKSSVINLIPGAPADATAAPPKSKPKIKTQVQPKVEPTNIDVPAKDKGPEVFQQMTRTITAPQPVGNLKSLRTQEPANVDQFELTGTEESVNEHGGGIGPRQHWQSLMREQGRPPMDTLNYYFPDTNAQSDVEAIRSAIRQIMNNPDLSKTSKQRLLGQIGMMVQRNRALIGREWRQYLDRFSESMQEMFAMPGTTVPRKSVIQGYTVYFNPETRTVSVTRGGDSEEAAIDQARIGTVNMKTFRNAAEKLIDRIEDRMISEGIKDTASATAVIACLLTGGSLQGCATAPQQTSAQQVLKTGQDIGRTVQSAKKITRAGVEAEVNQEIRNVMRGISRPEELNHSNILRIWKRIKGQPPGIPEPQAPEYGPAEPVKRPATEAKEILSKDDFIRERDRLLRMIGQETNPANKQILKSAIRQLENRAEQEGWIALQQRMVRENSDHGEAVEMAIMRRILVAHTDLIVEFGLDKVVQAIEEVAYDVGDVDEIGTSDVSGWVNQVKQILGATE